MTDKTISLKLPAELLQKAEKIASNGSNLHDFLVSVIEHEVQRYQASLDKKDFWAQLERLRVEMKQEEIEINPQEVWEQIRDKETERDIVL
ncbi:MAG: hypothetical protein AAF652_03380 [Cyanobacteria bacterium P01_C01_bin.72]